MTSPGCGAAAELALQQLRAERDAALQALAVSRASQEAFLRGVSHDLRAPLRHITSYGGLVREVLGDLPPDVVQTEPMQEALQFLGTMDHAARRMGQMIDGLMALARFGQATLQCAPVPLAEALAQARADVESLAPGGGAAGAGVQWDIASELPVLQADAAWLQTLLVQLLTNALKFSRGRSPVRIAVRAEVLPAEALGAEGVSAGRWVAWTLEDNGAGFDMARADGLFGVFQRLHREAEFEGVGAGLALCLAIAQRHGAQITAQGRVGEGCTVRLVWPMASVSRWADTSYAVSPRS